LQLELKKLSLLLEILTPIAKSWPSEYCLEANKHAIQILGGYGYTREYPVERMYRDNRLNHIHEGTHAIHGIDVLGRKVRMYDGAALKALESEIQKTIHEAKNIKALSEYAQSLQKSLNVLKQTTQKVLACANKELALANATIYLDAMGHTVVAWLWLWQGIAAHKGQQSNKESDRAFYQGKLAACNFFDATCLDAQADEFIGI